VPRPTKLTPELQAAICQSIRDGNTRETAAGCQGISPTSLYEWLARGEKEKKGIYTEFSEAVKKADHDATAAKVKVVHNAAQADNWYAAAWWLERRRYGDWGKKERLDVMGADGDPVELLLVTKVIRAADDDSPPAPGEAGCGSDAGPAALPPQ
jgi:hypothetical protein